MRNRNQQHYFSPRVIQRLSSITRSLAKKNIHNWRQSNLVENAIRFDRELMTEIFIMSNLNPKNALNPKMVLALTSICTASVRQRLMQMQQLRNEQKLDPSHPNVTSNPYHPLNPANPNALQQLLQINATLNPMFMALVNSQAAVVEDENEKTVQNQTQENNLQSIEIIASIVTDPKILSAAQQEIKNNPGFEPHKTLGVDHNATSDQIQGAALYKLAECAPEKGAQRSHEYIQVAAAALIAIPTLNKEFGESLTDIAKNSLSDTPKFSPVAAG